MGIRFFESIMGRRHYEGTMPGILAALKELAWPKPVVFTNVNGQRWAVVRGAIKVIRPYGKDSTFIVYGSAEDVVEVAESFDDVLKKLESR